MDTDQSFIKYIRIAIVSLVFLTLCIGLYWFFVVRKFNSKQEMAVVEPTPREIKVVDKAAVNKVYDYTSRNIAPAQEVKVYGKFVSADLEQATIDNELYIYVIGVQNEDGSLSKIHLRSDEYEILGGTLPKNKFFVTLPVVVTINGQGVYIEPSS